MKRPAQPTHCRSGFTLLEMCIVLFIMALLAGVAVPTLRSVFIEQALRTDSSQIEQLVKNAMLTSDEQQRPYVIKLKDRMLSLEPVEASIPQPGAAPDDQDGTGSGAPTTVKLDHVLRVADSDAKDGWATPHSASWEFDPNGLCPVPRLRLEDGGASLEVSFNALTGDAEDDSLSIP